MKSRFSQLKRLKTEDYVSTSQSSGNVINPEIKVEAERSLTADQQDQDSVHKVPVDPSAIILGNIIEKKYDMQKYEIEQRSKDSTSSRVTGFPEVFVSDHMKNDSNQSLFLQQIAQKEHVMSKPGYSKDSEISYTCENSVLVEGSWATEIHRENLEHLSQMTQEDILKEKKKLEMILKPDLIQFLRDRRNKQVVNKKEPIVKSSVFAKNESERTEGTTNVDSNEISNSTHEVLSKGNVDVPMEVEEPKEIIPKPSIELMEQAKEKGWIHMDSLEPEKMKWMEDLALMNTENVIPDEPYNARFDFNGMLLPYKDDDVSVEKGLHHHGEEPERPGYSLQELLQLSRSSAQQQRFTALTTLANIIEKSRKGWYDKALQPAPLIVCSQRNLLLLLRFSLDDTSVAVVTATLQALRAFLYSEADEVCLDRLYGFNNYKEPVLIPPKSDIKDTSDLKDHEFVQLDAVAALLRTDILLRLRYILSEMQPPPIGVTCALELLTRFTRHSNITALNIASTPYLLDTITKNFLPLSADSLVMHNQIDNVYGVPVTAAVKFCRVLICYGGKLAAQRLDRLKVVQSIMSYISCDVGKGSITLCIESLRLWKILLLHQRAMDSLAGAQLILGPQLQLLLTNHDIQNASELSSEYAATLITVASCLPALRANISVLLCKWSTQLLSLPTPTWGNTKLIAETLLAIDDTSVLKQLIISRSQVFSKLCSTSNLLSDCTSAADREPVSLPNIGVLTQDGQLQPIVSHHSCIPFLATVLNVFVHHSFTAEIQAVLSLPEVCTYLKRLETEDWRLESSWYTRAEFSFLTAIVNASSLVKDGLNNKTAYIIWKIAIKLISSLPCDYSSNVMDMLRVALSDDKLNAEMLTNELAKLNLNQSVDEIKMNLNNDVLSLYERYITSSEEWSQAAMPKDWLYLPLVHIYTKCKNSGTCNHEDKNSILTLLSLELVLPDLVEKLLPSLRFSRLVLVYLCDTLFLNTDVSVLLWRVIPTLLKAHYKEFNFSHDLPGLNSFTDLFTAMCEQFFSVSYGDYGFSMVLLIPIVQRHDVHYRKLLWSEHAGVLRYLRLPIEQLVIPFNEYLYPLEEDTSLIENYITALVRGIIKESWCPIPYAIAVHHSAMYLKQSNKLALRMRAQVQKLSDKGLAATLLRYEPSL